MYQLKNPTISLLLLITLVPSCAIYSARNNREFIIKELRNGMDEQELIKRLGEPDNREVSADGTELVYYETDWIYDSFCGKYTPIRLKSGRVEGFGISLCKEPPKSDSTLKQ